MRRCSWIVTAQKQAAEASEEARLYAEAIVRTLRTPLLVVDGDARVLSANTALYDTFQMSKEETEGRILYELGNRQWDIPALRVLLEHVLPERKEVRNYDVEHDFEHIGRRLIRLNASLMTRSRLPALVLVSLEDITEQKKAERAAGERTDELHASSPPADTPTPTIKLGAEMPAPCSCGSELLSPGRLILLSTGPGTRKDGSFARDTITLTSCARSSRCRLSSDSVGHADRVL